MDPNEPRNRFRVGLFLAVGLAAVATLVVYFGRLGEGIRRYYDLRVEFPNASGLLNGASVLLAGARVGTVASAPQILPDMQGVFVRLKIYEEVRIPQTAIFRVGSSGLLGDRFVEILPGADAADAPAIAPGSTVQGRGDSGGFAELSDSAGDLIQEVRQAVQSINDLARKLDSELLSAPTLERVRATIAHIEKSSAAISEASVKFDGILEQAGQAVAGAGSALASAQSAAAEIRTLAADARALLHQARSGPGLLAALLSDRQMADNLRALAANLRRHGLLFYRDSADSQPPAARRSRGN